MSRRGKALVAILATVAALILAVPLAAPFLVDVDRFRAPAEKALTAALGRRVTLGPLRLSLWTGPAIAAASVRIDGEPGIDAGKTVAHVALRHLVAGRVEMTSISVRDLRVSRAGRAIVRGARLRSRVRQMDDDTIEITDLTVTAGPLRVGAGGRVTGLAAKAPRFGLTGSARLARTRVDGRLDVSADSGHPKATFDLDAPLIDVDEVIAAAKGLGDAPAPLRSGSSWLAPAAHADEPAAPAAPVSGAPDLEASGGLRAQRCVARGLEATAVSMRMALSAGIADVSEISFAVYGGTGRGSASLRPFVPGIPYSIEQRAEGVSVEGMIGALSPAHESAVAGKAALSVSLHGDAAGPAAVPSTTGTIDISVVDGTIESKGAIRQVMEALVAAGATGIDRKTTPFDHLSSHFDVAQGIATTGDLEFRSADVDADGKGTVALTGAVSVDVLASFSRAVSDALVAKTRALSVRRGDDGRITVPLQVRGTVRAPRLQLDLNRVLSEGVVRELKKEGTRNLLKKLLRR